MNPPFKCGVRCHQSAERIPKGSTVRVVQFDTLEAKARWIDAMAGMDALRERVLDVARRFIGIEDPEARTRALHRFIRDGVRYEQDYRVSIGEPGEELADTESTLNRGYGDCDDKSRAYVALVRAVEMLRPLGTQARIRDVFIRHPYAFVHVQVEVRWPRSNLDPRADACGWLLAEMILKGAEIGDNPDDVARGPRGERVLA